MLPLIIGVRRSESGVVFCGNQSKISLEFVAMPEFALHVKVQDRDSVREGV